jgi:hypothetical protein
MDKIIFWLIVIVALVAIGPLLTIWALNTLFPVLNITYGLDTWAAIILLGAFFRANVTVKQ